MDAVRTPGRFATSDVLAVVQRVWGFDQLRPLQEQAICAQLDGRDSLVVMPTGGGKSLCYQVPPLLSQTTGVVVSPLISLMKDQVDGLRANGYPAAALHSGMTSSQRSDAEREVRSGRCRLLFVSPERLLTSWFLDLLRGLEVRSFAIDEAHCISHWGHDFRQEYRKLAVLKEHFPEAGMHAYTATATERVRLDIAAQLHLRDPEILVGRFDRANLTYRVVPRVDAREQTAAIIRRHQGEAVIVYCMTRKDADSMAESLRAQKIDALPYHAGMDTASRHRTQEAFAGERINVIAATVAFGMGIDRSNVRCIIHAAMPKSIEHYQQETGRAGRDGLEAECVLLYSAADAMKWESLIRRSAESAGEPEEVIAAHLALLQEVRRYAGVPHCRHKVLSEYFGQAYEKANCQACDVCLGEIEGAEDATVTAQKILSCVARAGGAFGIGHIVDVLRGSDNEIIRRRGHHQLSTYGLLKEMPRKTLMNYAYQLVDLGLVERTTDEYPVLRLNAASWEVMRSGRKVMLLKPRSAPTRQSRGERESWIGVDQALFERLRKVRRELAVERNVAAYVIFSDATLRDMARKKPRDYASMLAVHGIGQAKLAQFGERFLEAIKRGSGLLIEEDHHK